VLLGDDLRVAEEDVPLLALGLGIVASLRSQVVEAQVLDLARAVASN